MSSTDTVHPAPPTGRPLASSVVLVTGGAGGLGREIVAALASAGAEVAVTARDVSRLEPIVAEVGRRGTRAVPIAMDLRERASIGAAVDAAMDAFGRIDVLVCNSGIAGPSSSVLSVTDAEWDDTIAVNLTGTFLCAREVARHMAAAKQGSIVLIGSMTGKRPLLNRAPYAASKMALVGLSRTMAWDLGPDGIRVNVVSPGFVDGERLDWVVDAQATAQGRPPAEILLDMEHASPLSRVTSPEDVARAVVFLASDASGGITGEDLNVSSGIVMHG